MNNSGEDSSEEDSSSNKLAPPAEPTPAQAGKGELKEPSDPKTEYTVGLVLLLVCALVLFFLGRWTTLLVAEDRPAVTEYAEVLDQGAGSSGVQRESSWAVYLKWEKDGQEVRVHDSRVHGYTEVGDRLKIQR